MSVNNASGAIALQHDLSQSEYVLAKFGDDLRAIATRLGYPYKRVWNWRSKGVIPQEWHQPLLDRAAALGVALHPHDFVAHLHLPVAAPRSRKKTG